jgi:hypothetical protein
LTIFLDEIKSPSVVTVKTSIMIKRAMNIPYSRIFSLNDLMTSSMKDILYLLTPIRK